LVTLALWNCKVLYGGKQPTPPQGIRVRLSKQVAGACWAWLQRPP
jgi:hypothetical protein